MPSYARGPAVAALALILLAVLAGGPPTAAPASVSKAVPKAPAQPDEVFHSDRSYATVAEPVRLRISALEVDSKVEKLGLQRDGSIAVPGRTDVAGWYEYGPRPGEPGPSVILGHVDSAEYGPGVFFKLGALHKGDTVDVTRADSTVAVFRVDRVASFPKDHFPTLEVYGNTDNAQLRLITCGGKFDFSARSYESNIVVFASLVSSHRA